MSFAAVARGLCKRRAMNKRLLIGSALGTIIIRSIALLRVSASNVVVGHVDRLSDKYVSVTVQVRFATTKKQSKQGAMPDIIYKILLATRR